MFRLRSVQGKNRLRNVHTKSSSYEMFIQNCQVTKCSSYKMLGYEIIRLRDTCYELWLRNVRYEMSKLQNVRLRND